MQGTGTVNITFNLSYLFVFVVLLRLIFLPFHLILAFYSQTLKSFFLYYR